MTAIYRTALGFALATMLASTASASCGRFGGWGIGVTEDIAKFMSNKAMHQALDKENAKPLGSARTECNNNAVVYIQCHTFTKACGK